MTTWFEELGFTENPFSLDPIPPQEAAMAKGFINREKEKNIIVDFIQSAPSNLIFFGMTGEGKSSLLNLLQCEATRAGYQIIRVNSRRLAKGESFIDELLHQLELQGEHFPDTLRTKLKKRVEDLNVMELRQKEETRTKGSLEGRIGGFIASVSGKAEAEESKHQAKVRYVAPRWLKLERLEAEFFPAIFGEIHAVIIADNLEKLEADEFKSFLSDTSNHIPEEVHFAATGDLTSIDSQTMNRCYDVFDSLPLMDSIDTSAKLREFIEKRMKGHHPSNEGLIRFDDAALDALFDRTRGNLREAFRYSLRAIQISKADITRKQVVDAITDVDKPRYLALGDPERQTLRILLERDSATVKEVTERFGELGEMITIETARSRLHSLVEAGFAWKEEVKTGRTYTSVYRAPKILSETTPTVQERS